MTREEVWVHLFASTAAMQDLNHLKVHGRRAYEVAEYADALLQQYDRRIEQQFSFAAPQQKQGG